MTYNPFDANVVFDGDSTPLLADNPLPSRRRWFSSMRMAVVVFDRLTDDPDSSATAEASFSELSEGWHTLVAHRAPAVRDLRPSNPDPGSDFSDHVSERWMLACVEDGSSEDSIGHLRWAVRSVNEHFEKVPFWHMEVRSKAVSQSGYRKLFSPIADAASNGGVRRAHALFHRLVSDTVADDEGLLAAEFASMCPHASLREVYLTLDRLASLPGTFSDVRQTYVDLVASWLDSLAYADPDLRAEALLASRMLSEDETLLGSELARMAAAAVGNRPSLRSLRRRAPSPWNLGGLARPSSVDDFD